MKAITILEPWASLIACGAKQIETRSWPTSHRGPIAIHAAKNMTHTDLAWKEPMYSALKSQHNDLEGHNTIQYHPGSIIAIANLVDCIRVTDLEMMFQIRDIYGKSELAFGDFEPGRYGWILADVKRIKPVAVKGMQRLWNWDGGECGVGKPC